jgi:hypothetical protein
MSNLIWVEAPGPTVSRWVQLWHGRMTDGFVGGSGRELSPDAVLLSMTCMASGGRALPGVRTALEMALPGAGSRAEGNRQDAVRVSSIGFLASWPQGVTVCGCGTPSSPPPRQ